MRGEKKSKVAKMTSKKKNQDNSILEAFIKKSMFKVLGVNFNILR